MFCLDAATGKLIWKTEEVDGKGLKGVHSSPILSEDGKSVLVGSGMPFDDRGGVYLLCLDAATGKVRWSRHVPHDYIMGAPAVHGGMVVVGAGAVERNDHAQIEHTGFVMAVRVSDGSELWRMDVVDPESSPAFGPDGTLYIGSGLPLEHKPAALWFYRKVCEPDGIRTFDADGPKQAAYAFVNWPLGLEPRNPAEVLGHMLYDREAQFFVFRSGW